MKSYAYILGVLLLTGQCVVATEIVPAKPDVQKIAEPAKTEESKHVPAGTRAMLPSEYIANKVRLAAETASVEEEPKTSLEDIVKPNSQASIDQLISHGSKAGIYFTTHVGAYHCPIAIHTTGYDHKIELEDNSVWSVSPDDTYKLYNWLATDVVVITPNHSWLSIYDYCIVNQNTGTYVQANLALFLNPLFHTSFNHRIVAIDDVLQMVWLQDGSRWSITSLDYSTRWQINDTIIIGVNDGWLSATRPNILINANILHSVRANCCN